MSTVSKPNKTTETEASIKSSVHTVKGKVTKLTQAEKAEVVAFYQKVKPMLKNLPLD